MFKLIAAASLLFGLAFSAAAAELQQKETRRPGVAVSEFLERSSKTPQGSGDAVLIKAIAELKAKEDASRAPGLRRVQAEATNERCIFRLRNVPAVEVGEALQERVHEQQGDRTVAGQAFLFAIVCEPVSNCLVVSAPSAMMENFRQLIAACDVEQVMVSVDVLIARVLPGAGPKDVATRLAIPERGEDALAWLAALEAQKRLEVLSRPKIMTLDQQQVGILIGEERRATGSATLPEPFIGLQVELTPHVGKDGPIRLDVAMTKTSVGKPEDEAAELVHEINLRTTISLNDGETEIVSGQASDGRPVVVSLTPRIVSEVR